MRARPVRPFRYVQCRFGIPACRAHSLLFRGCGGCPDLGLCLGIMYCSLTPITCAVSDMSTGTLQKGSAEVVSSFLNISSPDGRPRVTNSPIPFDALCCQSGVPDVSCFSGLASTRVGFRRLPTRSPRARPTMSRYLRGETFPPLMVSRSVCHDIAVRR